MHNPSLSQHDYLPDSDQHNQMSAAFVGLGNMGSKVHYLAGQPSNGFPTARRRICFRYGIIRPDDITLTNLTFLVEREFLEQGTTFFVAGDAKDERTLKEIVGDGFHVYNEKDFDPSQLEVDLYVDFTYNAKDFVERVRRANRNIPVIVQSNNYGYGTLYVPPLRETKNQKPEGVYRAADCSLGGTIPVLALLKQFFEEWYIHFVTDRNVGKGPKSEFDNTFYFTDSYGRRKSNEFSLLTGVSTVTTFVSSPMTHPFYIATISGKLREEEIEAEFKSLTQFEKHGYFSPLLENNSLVCISTEDSTAPYHLPPEPPDIRAFSSQYPDFPCRPPIVYFRRSHTRRGAMASFTIGFDVNIAATVNNIQVMDAISTYALST
ncbi:hypothetical protein HYW21_01935 [Candidatus Woesearchaeota archaeon]|nr:hypothetical protein [Candidatus Woesearchaeota archaeon]